MKILKPFEQLNGSAKGIIMGISVLILFTLWGICSMGTTHLFPSISQVLSGFSDLYHDGLVTHIGSSLGLFFKSVFISVFISLIFCYL
jgi:NitT/TauT family transport system permease protein